MKIGNYRSGPGLTEAARLVLFPWRAAWATANRCGFLGEAPIGSAPHLDDAALKRWRKVIAKTNVYLEYGSGGSTVEAVQSAAHVISVETDKGYLAAVERKVAQNQGSAAFRPIHVDIGWTEKWGRPLLSWRSDARLTRWRRYSSAPWRLLDSLELVPDFIFIDGRFRTASVLDSFLQLPDDATCLFMLDDFEGRKERYKAVLVFAANVETVGRALVFRRDRKFNRAECSRLLAVYQAEPE